MHIAQLDFAPEMGAEILVVKQGGRKPDDKQRKRKSHVPACDTLEPEIGRTPKVVLPQQVTIRSICNHYGA